MNQSIAVLPDVQLPLNIQEGVEYYLQKITHLPTLSAEQESVLAHRWRQNGDMLAAKQLVLSQLRFVVHIARGYMGYGLGFTDLVQEGNIGLMKAVKRFDPAKGVRLISFAVHWIKAEIHEYIVRNWRIVKVATTKAQRKLFFNLRQRKKSTHLSLQDADLIAEELKVPVTDVHEMNMRLTSNDVAFDAPVDDEEKIAHTAPAHYLEDHRDNPFELLSSAQDEKVLDTLKFSIAQNLNSREQTIIMQRWLCDDEEKMTLQDLAIQFGISIERVRQLEKAALAKLKTALISG